MARPKKQTVDYFPHSCTHKKTMFILEQKYGNDGYALWFKLLEMLGTNDGHYLNCNIESNWEFLQAITRLDSQTCNDILDLLAKLEAIDSELWESKIVWSDNFVEGIADVYKNRKVEKPNKPSFYRQKPSGDIVSTSRNPSSDVVSTNINTQSKLKETIVNKTTVDESIKKESIPEENIKEETIEEQEEGINIKTNANILADKVHAEYLRKQQLEAELIKIDTNIHHPGLGIWLMANNSVYKVGAVFPKVMINKNQLPEITEKLEQIWPTTSGINLKDAMTFYLKEQQKLKEEPNILTCLNNIINYPDYWKTPEVTL